MSKRTTRRGAPEPDIQQRWNEYPRVSPGEYPAYVRLAKRYRDPGYRRWTCLLGFDLLSEDLLRVIARVPMWLNLGSGLEPAAARRSRYTLEWVRANGGPPARKDRLSPKVFERRMARVEIGDTDPARSPIPYSVVRKILRWETGQSFNTSHIKGGMRNEPQRERLAHALGREICPHSPDGFAAAIKKGGETTQDSSSVLAGIEGVNQSNTHPRAGDYGTSPAKASACKPEILNNGERRLPQPLLSVSD